METAELAASVAALVNALGPLGLPWIAGLFGLLVGSFLNVVIHRLPLMMQFAAEHEAREILALEATADSDRKSTRLNSSHT